MVIGACRVRLHLPGNNSLKGKRSRLKPILVRLPREFNVVVAETDLQDMWQSAELSIVTVSNEAGVVYSILEKAVHWLERATPELEVVEQITELR